MTRLRRAVLSVFVVASIGAVGVCTVPTNSEPVELSGTIPFGLLETTTTTSTSVPQAVTKDATVFLLSAEPSEGRLVPVSRSVDVAADVQEILANLFTVRPDGDERPAEEGLASSIPESATLLSATRAQTVGRLIVDVRGLFGNEGIRGVALRNALAQIVWTATEIEDITEVVFRNSGTPVQALADDGQIVDGPVNRNNYAQGT